MAKDKTKKSKFTGIFVPAKVLAMKNISMIEKLIIADIGYFDSNSYRFSNAKLAEKFGVSRRTIINAISRLKSPNLGFLIDVSCIGRGRYLRCLKLSEKGLALLNKDGANLAPCSGKDGAEVAPYGAEVAPYRGKDGANLATIDKQVTEEHLDKHISLQLSRLLLDLIIQRKPDYRDAQPDRKEKTIEKWAIHVERMIRLDNRKPERIEKVIRWSQNDSFWQDNVLSTKTIREKFDRFEMKMEKNGTSKIHRADTQYKVPAEYADTAIEV